MSFISHGLSSPEIDGGRTTFLGAEALDLQMCSALMCRELLSLFMSPKYLQSVNAQVCHGDTEVPVTRTCEE